MNYISILKVVSHVHISRFCGKAFYNIGAKNGITERQFDVVLDFLF